MGAVRRWRRPLVLRLAVTAVALAAYVTAMVVVVAKFEWIFMDLDIELPRSTLDLILVSRAFRAWTSWLPFLGIAIAAVVMFAWYRRHFTRGQWLIDRMGQAVLSLPWCGRLVRLRTLSRFLRDLGCRIASGSTTPAAAAAAVDAVRNQVLRREFAVIGPRLSDGLSLAAALTGIDVLSPSLMRAIMPLADDRAVGLGLQGIAAGLDVAAVDASDSLVTAMVRLSALLMFVSAGFCAWALFMPLNVIIETV